MPPPERRDSNLDSNGSVIQYRSNPDQLTSFRSTDSLPTSEPRAGSGPTSARYFAFSATAYELLIISLLSGLSQNGGSSHQGPSSSHSPLFSVTPGHVSPGMKRKQIEPSMGTQVLKRRREVDDGDSFDLDGNGQGAKHWTDEEKSKLFSWLMGAGQDEHWSSLRATKNSCLREVRPTHIHQQHTHLIWTVCNRGFRK